MAFERESIKASIAALAAKGVYIGTSSWKYEGWIDQLYTPARYTKEAKQQTHSNQELFGEFQATETSLPKIHDETFEKNCLREYAEVFKTVCVDATYYKFPDEASLIGLNDSVPDDFRFSFKITKEISIKRFPNHPKEGKRAGTVNPNYLNPDLFSSAFVKPCGILRSKVGVLIFEFSRFWPSEYKRVSEFVSELDRFLGELPKGWPYAVEMRNKDWLVKEYFDCLAKHRVTHVFNSWDAMPAVGEQMALPGSVTNPAMLTARFLTAPGRKYADAKRLFHPYKLTKEANSEARKAIAALIKLALAATGGNLMLALIYINNRMEGNALNMIAEVLASDDWR